MVRSPKKGIADMTKIFESKKMKVSELRGGVCARDGCTNTFKDEKPAGWVNLLVWWSPWPEPELTVAEVACGPLCKRDAVLCPEHAAELEAMLKDIGGKLRDVAGSA